jgi:NADP-dependent 3-hydroxy acid dehydrogenase YdfG
MTIKNPTQNIHAFITGVSSGIGRALAENMLEKGYRVSGIARREAALKTLAAKYDQFFRHHR